MAENAVIGSSLAGRASTSSQQVWSYSVLHGGSDDLELVTGILSETQWRNIDILKALQTCLFAVQRAT